MMNIGVGGGLKSSMCVPFVSQYSDCSDANACSGCTRCSCNETGQWECQNVIECPEEEATGFVDDDILENALDVLYEGLENKNKRPESLVPAPPNPDEDLLLVPDKGVELEKEIKILMGRYKRSVHEDKNNDSVKFYGAVDEINEDTLKDSNSSGTIEAHKFNTQNFGKMSRRTEGFEVNNDTSDLHIEYSKPHELDHHIAENKIDSKHPTEDKINGLSHEEIHKILGNYSQVIKDKELSKLVVNELTRGNERIGDKNVVPVSNITFTPENDTLTAMTFIAGNLLNKLWDMEKDATEGSYETEIMKHEKINDLLELFKEPLSLRQETFLKNALVQLSRAIDKDIKNMSLCTKIEDTVRIEPDNNNCTEKSKTIKDQDLSNDDTIINSTIFEHINKPSLSVIRKINDVLNLMKKYEQLQEKISEKKYIPESNAKINPVDLEKNISKDEKVSLNLFRSLLDKITNLLSPSKFGKNMSKRLQTYNFLKKDDDIPKRHIEKMSNINLANTALGAKDRMIIDYLGSIKKHPNCFFTHLKKPLDTPLSNVEGSILYNLSEFFKIKSFTDLLNIVNEKQDKTIKQHNTTFEVNTTSTTSTKQSKDITPTLRINSKPKNESAKERLKNDLKNILQDLFDLQREQGIKSKNNINIADALPCIYNILKSDSDNPHDYSNNNAAFAIKKISSFIDSLKLDMKMSPNRRSNTMILSRPKSAIVWERTIKNLNKKHQKASRRSSGEIPKNYTELRDMMDKVELSGNTYKNFAIQSGVAPSERLILLKTLEADIKQYMNVLEAIKNSLVIIVNLPTEKQNEFLEFIDNAAMNINLNKKLVALASQLKAKSSDGRNSNLRKDSHQPLIAIPKWQEANENKIFKLKRDQIMNQLIMNRMKLYIKRKERTEFDLNANANYNIAKRILFHLENGNVALAKDLYKVFLANQLRSSEELSKFTDFHEKESYEINEKLEPRERKELTIQEPLIKVEDARKIKMLTQDYFLKQLWNLKELKE